MYGKDFHQMDMSLFGFVKRPGEQKQQSAWKAETQTKEFVDWTHFLSSDAVAILRYILERAYEHRSAYFKAEDIKNAQLWSAVLELQKQINELNERISKLEPREERVYRTHLGSDQPIIDKINEVMTPTAQDTKEATDALVNSLMKF